MVRQSGEITCYSFGPGDYYEEERVMNAKLLGFFSGFPTRHFTDDIADGKGRCYSDHAGAAGADEEVTNLENF